MNKFKSFDHNDKGRDFVIGDIHGSFRQLMNGIEAVNFNFEDDRLFCVGDLIDRGVKSLECLNLLGEPWFHTVIGNHEMMMLDYVSGQDDGKMWRRNGGEWFFELEDKEPLNNIIEYLKEFVPYAMEFYAPDGRLVGITHTDIPIEWDWDEIHNHFRYYEPKQVDYILQHILWSRARVDTGFDNKEVANVDLVVHGHTPTQERLWSNNCVFIDQRYYQPKVMKPINIMDLLRELDEGKN